MGHSLFAGLIGCVVVPVALATVGVMVGFQRFGLWGAIGFGALGLVVGALLFTVTTRVVDGVLNLVFGKPKAEEPVVGEVVVGGLYATPSKEGFRILKVLAVGDGVVHVRMYANVFGAIPGRIDPKTLDLGSITAEAIDAKTVGPLGVGHMPFSMALFFRGNPRLVQQETVSEEELDGFREWKDAGGGVFG